MHFDVNLFSLYEIGSQLHFPVLKILYHSIFQLSTQNKFEEALNFLKDAHLNQRDITYKNITEIAQR